MNHAVNHTLLCLISLIGLAIFVPEASWATDCGYPRSTLEADHVRAQAIVVAQVTGCADAQLSENGHCPNERYMLGVIEVLKDSVPSRDHGGAFEGSAIMGCGLQFRTGHEYLLFIDAIGNIAHGASGYLGSDGPQTIATKERLAILKQYRDGDVDDLSEPWRFFDQGQACSISHLFNGGELTLTFGYGDGSYYRSHRLERTYGPNGEIRVDTAPDVPKEESFHGEMIGPDYGLNAFLLSVTLEDSVVPGSMTIKVGDRVWPLHNRTIRIQFGDSTHVLINANVTGRETANEIFEAIIEPADIVISAVASGIGPEVIEESTLLFETRSTQLPSAAKKFKYCAEDIVRQNNAKFP